MSKLTYDGTNHKIEIIKNDGTSGGKWTAYNNIDSSFANKHWDKHRHLPNDTYTILDKKQPNKHEADAEGSYGLYGIIRFDVPNHSGVGVHSGRAHDPHTPGPEHATHGCIRTTDAAMLAIKQIMAIDPLTTITVFGNSEVAAQSGKTKAQAIVHGT